MVTSARPENISDIPFKSELTHASIPETAVLGESLKLLEIRLQNRGLLNEPHKLGITPVWFLVETERSVFLWRNGYSLADQDSFEFWVDVQALIKKRLGKLENPDLENPFTNLLWGLELNPQSKHTTRAEIDYLEQFRELFENIAPHAHMISKIGSLVRAELSSTIQQIVILPRCEKAAGENLAKKQRESDYSLSLQ